MSQPSSTQASLPHSVGTHARPISTALVAILVVATFLPYAGLPLSQKESLSLSTIISYLLATAILIRELQIPPTIALLILTPFISGLAQVFLGRGGPDPKGLLLWLLNVAPVMGVYVAVRLRHLVLIIKTCQAMLTASCAYALVQKFLFLDRGVLPLQWLYSTPGYARVDPFIVTQYVKRPFGWYPEPSVLAATISLGLAAVALMELAIYAQPSVYTRFLLAATLVTIFLSQSGSGIFAFALLPIIIFGASIRKASVAFLAIFGTPLVVMAILALTKERNSSKNWSWDDRMASIIGSLRYQLHSLPDTLFGVGRGVVPHLFDVRTITADDFAPKQALHDVFSVLVRIVLESGFVTGLILIVSLCVAICKAARLHMPAHSAAALVALWLVSAGLTTSYESIAWIWCLPGIALGLIDKTKFGSLNANPADRQRSVDRRGADACGRAVAGSWQEA